MYPPQLVTENGANHLAMPSILIVGAGVVGEATGRGFMQHHHSVTFVDISQQRIQQLHAAGLPAVQAEDVSWHDIDIVMLTVSTPTENGVVNLEYIEAAAAAVGAGLAKTSRFVTVVVRSTVPPTTTLDRIRPILERYSGKTAGVDFGLAMNPEFLRQKTAVQDFARPWITVLGTTDPRTFAILQTLFKPFGGLVINCTPTEAEMIKYVNNIYNAVKISYFNEVHQICQALDINSDLVGAAVARSAESMWNPLYGIRGGVPYGGACLPKDTKAFQAFCHEQGFVHSVLDATIQVNEALAEQISPAAAPDEISQILKAKAVSAGTHLGPIPAPGNEASPNRPTA